MMIGAGTLVSKLSKCGNCIIAGNLVVYINNQGNVWFRKKYR